MIMTRISSPTLVSSIFDLGMIIAIIHWSVSVQSLGYSRKTLETVHYLGWYKVDINEQKQFAVNEHKTLIIHVITPSHSNFS